MVSRILALAAILSLTGCQSAPQKAATSVPPHEETFHKKMECEKYYDKLKDKLEHDQFISEALYRVFYSPKRNSCLAARYTISENNSKKDQEKVFIEDILSHEKVWSEYYDEPKQYPVVQATLDEQIKKQGLE
jgi:hypothetical protein